jgi:ABC-type uncharacterized transport system permease subunit
MVYDYVVTLKNKNARLVDNISLLLCVLTLLVLINSQLTKGPGTLVIVICSLMVLILAWSFFTNGKTFYGVHFSRILLLAGIGWLTVSTLEWVALPVIAMAFIEKPAKSNLEIGFSAGEIVINTLFKRRFSWIEFTNIMLKDDLLTMDFKDNKVLQRQTIEDEQDATEDEFNEYCAKQLSQSI